MYQKVRRLQLIYIIPLESPKATRSNQSMSGGIFDRLVSLVFPKASPIPHILVSGRHGASGLRCPGIYIARPGSRKPV